MFISKQINFFEYSDHFNNLEDPDRYQSGPIGGHPKNADEAAPDLGFN